MTRYRRYKEVKDRYRLDRILPPTQKNGKKSGFETEHAMCLEDAKRIRLLTEDGRAEAKDLIRYLERPAAPISMACGRNMREERLEFSANVLEALENWPASSIRFFTALPPSGEVPAGKLLTELPKPLDMERFRQQLNRVHKGDETGFLAAILEAELEPSSRVLRFHLHGVATGSYVERLEQVRALPAYRKRDHVEKPLQLKRLKSDDDENRAKAVSYLLKNHWKQRRIGLVGKDGVIRRKRKSNRLEEPHHTDMLLWLDRHSVADISLFMGCRMRGSKLELTHPELNKPYMTRTAK